MQQTIPAFEKWIIRVVLAPRLRARSTSWAQNLFIEQGEYILRDCKNLSEEQMRQRIQLPRIRGLEPVSMDWSIAMTIEHLLIVANDVSAIIEELQNGRIPNMVPSTAAVKPRDIYSGAEAINKFNNLIREWPTRFDLKRLSAAPRTATINHPWFGSLNAAGWYKMLATHQQLHARQIEMLAREVVSGIGKNAA